MTTNYDVPHTVYLHCNAEGVVLYVGCTQNLEKRTAQHRRRAFWWSQVVTVEVDSVQPGFNRGRAREHQLIRLHEPKYNRSGNPAVARARDEWDALVRSRNAAWEASRRPDADADLAEALAVQAAS